MQQEFADRATSSVQTAISAATVLSAICAMIVLPATPALQDTKALRAAHAQWGTSFRFLLLFNVLRVSPSPINASNARMRLLAPSALLDLRVLPAIPAT